MRELEYNTEEGHATFKRIFSENESYGVTVGILEGRSGGAYYIQLYYLGTYTTFEYAYIKCYKLIGQ